MVKQMLLCAACFALLALNSVAEQPGATSPRYSPEKQAWMEGTVQAPAADSHITIRGKSNPYAASYLAFQRDYFAIPKAEREVRSRELREKYRGQLNYIWTDDNLADATFAIPYPDDLTIYDESRYGADVNSWTFAEEPFTYHLKDLKYGDRVLIGYDPKGNVVKSMYRINPIHTDDAPKPGALRAPLFTRPNPYDTNPPIIQPSTPGIDPRTGLHVMNLPSNATNPKDGMKSGSDSGNIMNSGSNSTNNK